MTATEGTGAKERKGKASGENAPVPYLSSSMVDSFLRCTQHYYYRYVEGIEPIVEAPELMMGRILHLGLEAHHLGKGAKQVHKVMCEEWDEQVQKMVDSTTQIWDEDRQKWKEMLELCVGMMLHYDAHYDSDDFDIIATEHEFDIPIGEGVARFSGKIDMVTADQDTIHLWDHKSVSSFGSGWETQNHLSRQFRRYAWAWWHETEFMPVSFVVNGLRKKLPSVPEPMKKGGLSQRKNIDTTSDVYRTAIKKHGLDESDYDEILAILDAKGNTFFRRDVIYFNEFEIKEAGQELYDIYRLMHDFTTPIKAPSPLCTKLWPCPYRSICMEDTEEARLMFREREVV